MMRTILSIVYDIVFHIERKINYFIYFLLFIPLLLSYMSWVKSAENVVKTKGVQEIP